MRAATIRDRGIVIAEHPDPSPGTGEVLVRVRAGQFDVLHDLGLGREFLHHFLFAPPQNERGNAAGQQFAAFVVFALLDGPAKN